MKPLPKLFLLNLFSFWLIASLLPIIAPTNLPTLAMAALALSLQEITVKPILHLLMLPINLITFRLLVWLPSILILHLTTLFVSAFTINPLALDAATIFTFHFPPIHFGYFSTLILLALILRLSRGALSSVLK